MITCPRCGAENKDDAASCRMCATALDPTAAGAPRPFAQTQQDIPATVVVQNPGAPQAGPAPGGKVTCPGCQATNDSDWAFCQQCGTRLAQQPQQQAAPQPAWGAPTVVTPAPPPMPQAEPPQQQQPVWGAPTVVTPAPDFGQQAPPPPAQNMPPAWGAPTVVTPMPPQGMPPAAPPPPPQQNWGAPTVITPSPDFGMPPAGGQQPPAWGAQTVVTPTAPADAGPSSFGNPPPPVADLDAYPETIVTPPAPPAPPPAPEPPPAKAEEQQRETPSFGGPSPEASYPPPAPAPPAGPGGQSTIVMSSTPIAAPPKQAKLLLIMEGGEVGETFSVRPAETVIGRVDGDIKFPHDGYMSSRHARILQRNGRFFLIDNNSRNGTFVKIHQEVELHPGDVILVGKQLFRFETDE